MRRIRHRRVTTRLCPIPVGFAHVRRISKVCEPMRFANMLRVFAPHAPTSQATDVLRAGSWNDDGSRWACPHCTFAKLLAGRGRRGHVGIRDDGHGGPISSAHVPLMGLPLVPITVSWPVDTKLFVRGKTATRKRHSAQIAAGLDGVAVAAPRSERAARGLRVRCPRRPTHAGCGSSSR